MNKNKRIRQSGLAALAVLLPILALSSAAGGFPDAPIICVFKRLTTLPCPACGMTAAFFELGAGSAGAAFALNAASPLFFAAFWFAAGLALVQLFTGKSLLDFVWSRGKRTFLIVFSAALAFAWVVNLWARLAK